MVRVQVAYRSLSGWLTALKALPRSILLGLDLGEALIHLASALEKVPPLLSFSMLAHPVRFVII